MLKLSVNDPKALAKISHALSTELRVSILSLLRQGNLSCLELSKALGYPLSTISANVRILENAGLIVTELLPAKNGSKKICSLVYLDIAIELCPDMKLSSHVSHYEASTPIGNFWDFDVSPSCGFAVCDPPQRFLDDPRDFLSPQRMDAQLLWFRKGFVEYRIPLDPNPPSPIHALSFELELCSEAPGYNSKWQSDITLWVNGVEAATWTSPADFGDRRGNLTPAFWELGSTQYGLLTSWRVTGSGVSVNGQKLSAVTLEDLLLPGKEYVTLRVGVKDDGVNVGGVNIFGRGFGDHPQDIVMKVEYEG